MESSSKYFASLVKIIDFSRQNFIPKVEIIYFSSMKLI